MCAIAGIVNFSDRSVHFGLLRRINDQLRHRGRNDEGLGFIDPDSQLAERSLFCSIILKPPFTWEEQDGRGQMHYLV